MSKPILCLDFDGVIHSYTSGWQGARNIPDPPVPGALQFIVEAQKHFTVAIFSSRSHQFLGRRAMKRWLFRQLMEAGIDHDNAPRWWLNRIYETAFADPWRDEVSFAAASVIRSIQWPVHKPAAMVSIDDRAWNFSGVFPGFQALLLFKPWNKS